LNKIINIILVLVFLANPVLGQFAVFGSRTNQEKFDRGVASFNDGRYTSAAGIFRKLTHSDTTELVTASAMMLMKSEYHAGNIANAKLVGGDFINRYPQSSYLKDVYLCFGDMFVNEGLPDFAFGMYLNSRRLTITTANKDFLDERLVKLVSLGLNIGNINTLEMTEGNLVNKNILFLARAFSHILAGEPDEAAAEMNKIDSDLLPEIYSEISGTIIRQTYKPAQNTLAIGVILPLTGHGAGLGQAFLNGLYQAVDQVENDSSMIVLSIFNNNSDAVESLLAVRQCVNNSNIKLIIGPLTSTNSITASAVAQEMKIPILLPESSEDNLTEIGDFVFQMNSTLTMRGRLAGRYLAGELDLDSLAVIAPFDEFGHSLADAFMTEVDALGKTVVAVEWYSGIPENLRRQFMSLRKIAFSLQESSEFDQYLGMEIDSLDAMFDIPDDIFFDIPESDEKPLSGSDSAKIVLETIQGLYIPIHPGHIQYLGTQFPSYNLNTQLIGNENWLDLEVLTQEIVGPHIDGMVYISNYFAPVDFSSISLPALDENVDLKYFYHGFDSGMLLAELAGTKLESRLSAKEKLASLDRFRVLTQIISFNTHAKNINTALRVLEYRDHELIDLGYFNGDSIIVNIPAIP